MADAPVRKLRLPGWLLPAAVAAILALAAGAHLGIRVLRSSPAPRASLTRRTIAVLPFRSLGGDPSRAYFSDGMAEEFSRLLARVRGLSVLAPTALSRYRDANRDPREVGREAGADLLLLGTAQRLPGGFRIQAEVFDVSSGSPVWRRAYDRPFVEIFDVQADAALEIGRALNLTFTPSDEAALRRRITANPEAYDCYLQGRWHFLESRHPQYEQAVHMFRQAVEVDPDFALAYAALGRTLAHWYREIRADPARLAESESAALRALRLDADLAEGRLALGLVRACQGRWNEALDLARQSLALRPDDAWTHAYLSWIYTYRDPPDPQHVLEHAEEAVRLNPELGPAYCQLARGLVFAGRDTEAEAALGRSLELMPDSFLPHQVLAEYFLSRGKIEQARDQIDFALSFTPDGPIPLLYLACIQAAQNETEQALGAWERAVERGFHDWDFARRLPCLQPIREEERFLKAFPPGGGAER